jgi:dihydrofolate reductase
MEHCDFHQHFLECDGRMKVSLVVAYAKNHVIGDGGKLPWRFSADLKMFKELTLGKAILMGRKTWDSLPRKPLPGRVNIVLTRSTTFVADGALVANSVEGALDMARDAEMDEVMVIGGGDIYKSFLPFASRIYATELSMAVDGDTLFPVLAPGSWIEFSRKRLHETPEDTVSGDLVIYERIDPTLG